MEAKLIVIRGKANKGEVALNLPTTIGRSRDSDLTVAHPMVSRRHCEIFEADGALHVRDLGSLNGTFVNGERVSEAELPHQAELTVGPLTFRAEYGQAAAEEELPAFDEVEGTEAVAFEALDDVVEDAAEAVEPASGKKQAAPADEEPDFAAFEAAVEDEFAVADEEEEKPKKKAKPAKTPDEEAEALISELADEEAEEEKPAKKKPAAKKPAADDFTEMENLEDTTAFTIDFAEEEEATTARKPAAKKPAAKKPVEEEEEEEEVEAAAEEEAPADGEAEADDGEPAKAKKGWWPFKRGKADAGKKAEPAAKKEKGKPSKNKKQPPPEEVEEVEEAVEEEIAEETPPPKKAASKKEVAKKPAAKPAPAKKGAKGHDLDLDELAFAAIQGDDEAPAGGGGGGGGGGQSEEDDLDDFLKGLQ
jgi:hypothetical protein